MKLHKDLEPDEFSPAVLKHNNIINDREYEAFMTWIWDKVKPKRYKILYKNTLNAIYNEKDILFTYSKYILAPNLCKRKLRYKTITKIVNYIKDKK